jgi:glyoxylase-like metal-dependent hydrolase (beta-lactamase superfamily II)
MVDVARFEVGAATLTRVPYFDVALDPAVANLTPEQVAALSEWGTPTWATAEGEVLIGQAIWVIESEGRLIVVDPCGAADPFIRSGPEAVGHQDAVLSAMTAAGYPPESVDVVALSHLDGIGLTAVVDDDGRWSPAFPEARIVLTSTELDFLAARDDVGGLEQLNDLIAQGAVDGVADGHRFTTEVAIRRTGGHSPGHAVIVVDSRDERAVLIGHLAISPLNTAVPTAPDAHVDADLAQIALDDLIASAAGDGSLVIGPLWPHPGAGQVTGDRRIVPAFVG